MVAARPYSHRLRLQRPLPAALFALCDSLRMQSRQQLRHQEAAAHEGARGFDVGAGSRGARAPRLSPCSSHAAFPPSAPGRPELPPLHQSARWGSPCTRTQGLRDQLMRMPNSQHRGHRAAHAAHLPPRPSQRMGSPCGGRGGPGGACTRRRGGRRQPPMAQGPGACDKQLPLERASPPWHRTSRSRRPPSPPQQRASRSQEAHQRRRQPMSRRRASHAPPRGRQPRCSLSRRLGCRRRLGGCGPSSSPSPRRIELRA